MPFPVSINGQVPLPDTPIEDLGRRVLIACLDQLEHENARIADDTDRLLSFRVPFFRFRAWNWWLTAVIDGGTIDVEDTAGGKRIRYRLSLKRLTVLATVGVLVMFVGLVANAQSFVPWAFFPVAWLWLVGGNYLFTLIRARFWFRRRIADAIKIAGPPVLPNAIATPNAGIQSRTR